MFGLYLFDNSAVMNLLTSGIIGHASWAIGNGTNSSKSIQNSRHWCINHSHPFIQKLHAGMIPLLPGSRTLFLDRAGRLGNVMFQLAASYAITKDTNAKLVVKDTSYLKVLQNFKHLNEKAFDFLNHSRKIPFLNGKKDEDFVKAVQHVVNESIILHHNLRKVIYFEGCAKEIKEKLQFKVNVIHHAKRALIAIAKLNNKSYEELTFVGIHVRRGDRSSPQMLELGYGLPRKSYFVKAMKYYKDKYKNVVFVIASDDRKWVTENLLGKDVYLSPLNTPAEDMALVSACNHTIISIGSFSWWCGFFNRGETVYYKHWLIPGTEIYIQENFQLGQLYPPNWIPMLD